MSDSYDGLVFGGPDDPGGPARSAGSPGATMCQRCGWPSTTCACDVMEQGGDFRQPRPPLSIWYAAIAAVLVGLTLTLGPFPQPLFAVVGWLLVGPLAILIYGKFMQRRTAVSSIAGYGEPSWLRMTLRVFPVIVIIAVGLAAWPIADWAGRI